MEARDTKQDTGKAHRGLYTKPDGQVGPDQPSRKRGRGAENQEPTENTRKSPRLQENQNRRCRNAEDKFQPQPSRKSPRLQEIRDLNQQRFKQAGKRTRSPSGTTRTHRCAGQKRPQAERRILKKSQSISAPTSRSSADGSPVSKYKRNRDQDDFVKRELSDKSHPGAKLNDCEPLSRHLPSTEKSVLRQWEFVSMPRSRKTGTQSRRTEDTTMSIKTISASDPRFPEIAANNGILAPMDSTRPSNFDEICEYLNRPRESASPDLDEYRQYLFDTATAENEDTVKQPVIGLLKKYNDGSYRSAYNQQFTEYPDNVGFNDGLSAPKPDLVQGINLQDFKPYPAREKLGGSAVPTPSKYAIALAHMAGEFAVRVDTSFPPHPSCLDLNTDQLESVEPMLSHLLSPTP